MGRQISLFNTFEQKENRVTNYCGLVLKLIYQESALAFQEIIASLIAESGHTFEMLPSFIQQERKTTSVPDLCLKQNPFNIYFETKVSDWFYNEQIERHIDNLFLESKDVENKILFILAPEFANDIEERLKNSVKIAQEKQIIIQCITFEDLISAINNALCNYKNNDSLLSIISEFEDYLSEENLLPNWKYTLDIINSGATKEEILNGFYACPNLSGAYSHKRAKYFGAYWEKKVNYIAYIKGIVVVSKSGKKADVKWNNTEDKNTDEILKKEAIEKVENSMQKWRIDELQEHDLQIFLLDELKEVNYIKNSRGGMMSSKIYRHVKANCIEELVDELNSSEWN